MIENNYNISPQQINYILELVSTRNFRKASENCFVTQPTLSMQIKKAEEILGFPIFDRSSNELSLTDSGEKLIPILRDVQYEYSRIWQLAKKLDGKHVEHLRVGVIPTISAYLLTAIFQKVQLEMEQVQLDIVELKSEELIDALHGQHIDIAIMAGPFIESRMRTIPLYQEEIKIYIQREGMDVISPEDLEFEHPWLLSKGNCLRTQMVHFCELDARESGLQSWNYEGGNLELLLKMVDLNGGYTLVPEFYPVDSPNLKRLYDAKRKEFPAREIIGVFHNRSLKKQSCERLVRIVQHTFQSKRTDALKILSWR